MPTAGQIILVILAFPVLGIVIRILSDRYTSRKNSGSRYANWSDEPWNHRDRHNG